MNQEIHNIAIGKNDILNEETKKIIGENMRGVILAAGNGTRLGYPNELGGKAMVPIKGIPLMAYGVENLVRSGITEIAIVVNPVNKIVVEAYFGNGEKFGATLTYIIQEVAKGIAQALGLCKDYVGGKKTLLLLVDNMLEAHIDMEIANFAKNGSGAEVFLVEVPNPSDFGVAEIYHRHVVSLAEKPANPKSNLAVIGVYMYDCQVYDIIPTLTPSARGEFEITDVNIAYLNRKQLKACQLEGWWLDVGNPERVTQIEALL